MRCTPGSTPSCSSWTEPNVRRSPVADQSRSWVRREDMGDGATAEGDGLHRFDGEWCGEERFARAQDDRMDDEAVLIDQAGLDQRSGEPCPALSEQISVAALLLEPRDGFGQVSG